MHTGTVSHFREVAQNVPFCVGTKYQYEHNSGLKGIAKI